MKHFEHLQLRKSPYHLIKVFRPCCIVHLDSLKVIYPRVTFAEGISVFVEVIQGARTSNDRAIIKIQLPKLLSVLDDPLQLPVMTENISAQSCICRWGKRSWARSTFGQ